MRILQDEDGQVLAITVLGAAMLMGVIGLAIDVGMLFRAQRQAQIAADAGAVAGALELAYNGQTNATANAKNAAVTNGIKDPTNVNVSLSGGGSHTGSGFVQVAVSQPNPTIFMNAMSRLMHADNFATVNVAARAVAGITPGPACIYLLNQTASGALSAKGAFTINAAGCGTDINSNSTTAVCVTGGGGAGTFNSPYIRVRAPRLTTSGSCNGTLDTPTFTNASNVSDPLGGFTGPTQANGWSGCDNTTNATSITPGDPSTQLTGVVCFSKSVQISGAVTLDKGTMYVFENGVEIMTGANVNIVGGTLDIAGGNLKKNGGPSCQGGSKVGGLVQDSNSTLNITAPTSTTAPSKGIAIMEPSGDTTPLEIQFGSNSGTYGAGRLDGLIYAPSAAVYLHDNGGTGVSATGLISDTLSVCSSSLTINSYNNEPGNASPLNSIQLVE